MRALLSFMKVGLKMEYEDYLAHYGILGQKWGIRRFQPYSVRGRQSGEGGKEVGLAKKKSKAPTKEQLLKSTNAAEVYKHRDQLSDRELRERVNRIQTEQQLRQLVNADQKVSSGKKFSQDVLKRVGTMAAAGIATWAFKNGKAELEYLFKDASLEGFKDFAVEWLSGEWKV